MHFTFFFNFLLLYNTQFVYDTKQNKNLIHIDLYLFNKE